MFVEHARLLSVRQRPRVQQLGEEVAQHQGSACSSVVVSSSSKRQLSWPANTMLIVSVLCLALLWGCTPPAAHRFPVVVGDSITVGLQTEGFLNVLGPSRDVDAAVGRGIQTTGKGHETGLSAVRRLAPSTRKGDWVIVELGTNDVMGYPDPHPLVRAVLAAIPADRSRPGPRCGTRSAWPRRMPGTAWSAPSWPSGTVPR